MSHIYLTLDERIAIELFAGAGVDHGHGHLFLQAAFAVAAWCQRKRQWPLATVFSTWNQLSQNHGKDVFESGRTTEQPASQMFKLPDPC